MLSKVLPLFALVVAMNAGCSAEAAESVDESNIGTQQSAMSDEEIFATPGTDLAIFGYVPVSCTDSSSATASFFGIVASSASSASAVVTVSGAFSDTLTIKANEWQRFNGRFKAQLMGLSSAVVSNGQHTITACATQSGSNGRASKSVCREISFSVYCAD
jgi:hypothetical protein